MYIFFYLYFHRISHIYCDNMMLPRNASTLTEAQSAANVERWLRRRCAKGMMEGFAKGFAKGFAPGFRRLRAEAPALIIVY